MAKFPKFFLCVCLSVASLVTPSCNANYTYVCKPTLPPFAFCNSSLPYAVRVKDLVDRMTLSEKVQQLGNFASGVPRLGLPKYEWWSEALHGVSNSGPGTNFDINFPSATSFPTVILTAASFNESLWKKIGQAVSTEARAMYNSGRAGLTYWSPTMNIARDPRWGRILETPGEDPFVVGKYAANYVRGLQDVEGHENYTDLNSRPLKVSSCCKHYSAYDLENWKGIDRFHFDSKVKEQDMVETFLRPFEMCVKEGDVSSIMCSYNSINGIPSCADHKLLHQTIREEWDLHGYIVSDCNSIEVSMDDHKYIAETKEDAVAYVLKAGVDLDCGTFYTNFTESAVQQGKIREGDIDKSLHNLYMVLMRVGFFDGSPQYDSLGTLDVCSPETIGLATEAAKEGIVLLKNDNQALPLNSSIFRTLAVVGPHANATKAMIGNYAGIPCSYISPLAGFSAYANVIHSMGCSDISCNNDSLIALAVDAAKNVDATIVLAGLDLSIEDEELDRENLLLPGYQTALINQIALFARGPVILVIMSAGGVDISFAKNNSRIQAILWAGYPGESGGQAIADIVFGKYNPGGRLPITWYESDYVDKIPMISMPFRPIDSMGYPGRTYKFFDGPTVYPFGYGLSYTRFKYYVISSNDLVLIKLDKLQHCRNIDYISGTQQPQCPAVLVGDLACKDYIKIEVVVQNVGKVDGNEVVMVYSKPPKGIAATHIKQVIGFQRVFVAAGQNEKIDFTFNVCQSLRIVDYAANSVLPSGEHTIVVGDGHGLSFSFEVDFSY